MISKLSDFVSEGGGVLLTSPHNMRYFSGFSGGEGAVLMAENGNALFTDSRYVEQAENETKNFEIINDGNWIAAAAEYMRGHGISELLFEDASMCVSTFEKLRGAAEGVRLCAASGRLDALRAVKSEAEIELLAKAEEIASCAYEKILAHIRPGVSEAELAYELEGYMRRLGGEGTSFDTIVVSGKKSSLPHGRPDEKKIEHGDFVTMDFGCIYRGYCSDMTRTVVVGKANAEQKKIYQTVLEAQETGLGAICAGVCARDADRAARNVIEKAGYGRFFGHALGHGVGLLIHELPNLSPRSDAVLEENMIVTCEPGIYVPDFGGVRIEDMVCVKSGGCLNFTHADKALLEL